MKIKSILIGCLFFNAIGIFAQNKFWIGASFRPELAHRVIFDGSQDGHLGWLIDTRNNDETGKLGFTTGVNMRYNLSSKWNLESGVLYSNKGYQTVAIPLSSINNPDPTPNSDYVYFRYNFTFIDVPVIARFNTNINQKFKFNFGLGVCNSLNINYKEIITRYNNNRFIEKSSRDLKNSSYKNYLISSHVSCGIEYMVDDRLSFVAEPSFQYAFTAMYKADVKQHLYTIGLNLGVWWRM